MSESKGLLYPEKWLSRASTGVRVACELRMRIISGLIESGTILSENKLGGILGEPVSHPRGFKNTGIGKNHPFGTDGGRCHRFNRKRNRRNL